jgi:hypothetical protein
MVITFSEIATRAPEVRGIYMWYFEFEKQDDLYINLATMMKSVVKKTFEVNVNSKFQENYFGTITGQESININQYDPKIKDFICEFLNKSVKLPLYIGLTVDQTLKKRLSDHAAEIYKLCNNSSISQVQPEEIANSFAYRIYQEFKNQESILNESYLRVECFSLPDFTTEEIQNIEKILKLFYRPIFGIK